MKNKRIRIYADKIAALSESIYNLHCLLSNFNNERRKYGLLTLFTPFISVWRKL